MNPAIAMDDVGATVANEMHRKVASLGQECHDIAAQWSQLKRMGAAREDHAADLLCRLRGDLMAIGNFSALLLKQIEAMKADPFEQGVEAAKGGAA